MKSDRFVFEKAPIEGVWLVKRKILSDDRGSFSRVYCHEEFSRIKVKKSIVQVNRSVTQRKGTVRGMHFQTPPKAEVKIVCCTKGKIWDVVVDLRRGSETFLQWFGIELFDERQLIVPEGVAHGFQTLEDNCEVLYFVTEYYCQKAENGINPLDSKLRIFWPLPITCLSEKDKMNPYILPGYKGVKL